MINRKSICMLALTAVLTLGGLAGCAKDSKTEANKELITVTDRNGEVEVPKNPEKVVVLDYGTVDTLEELGVKIAGLPKASLPSYLNDYSGDEYTDVGTLFELNYETINELNPDLIIIEGRQADQIDELKKIAPTIQLGSDGTNYINSVKSNTEVLGKIFDKEGEAKKQIEEIDNRIEAIKTKVTGENINALLTMVNEGSMNVYGAGSRFNVLYNEFGFIPTDTNIEVSKHGQSITSEYILEKNPNYLFVLDKGAITGKSSNTAKEIIENELVKSGETFKNGNIIYVNAEAWYVGGAGIKAASIIVEDVEKALKL